MDKADVIQQACLAAAAGQEFTARELLRQHYPFEPTSKAKRTCTLRQSIAIFEQDGFIDRYKGTRLVYPGALYLLSALRPEDFPSHRNGKMDRTHLAFWELFPTIDHVVPVACGGADDASNWVCTSMRSSQIKAHWRLEDLGWMIVSARRFCAMEWVAGVVSAGDRQASALGRTAFPAAAMGAGVVMPSGPPARLS